MQISFVFTCQVVGKPIDGEVILTQPDATPEAPLLSQPRAPLSKALSKAKRTIASSHVAF
jgi:hypothetical protein